MWPVGSLKPNDWGLFAMLGNAYEWTNSPCGAYPDFSQQTLVPILDSLDETTVTDNQSRVLRGGAFELQASHLRSANRYGEVPTFRNYS